MSREIDRKVAEALGWVRVTPLSCNWPHYSTDIAAAIGALEEYCKDDVWVVTRDRDGQYSCVIWPNGIRESFGKADTIPLAICNAICAASTSAEEKR